MRREFTAVCALLHRSGLHDVSQLTKALHSQQFHTSTQRYNETSKDPSRQPPKGPDKDDEDKDKISSLLAKAFLWMLMAYMMIAVISLMFPSSSQPEVRLF